MKNFIYDIYHDESKEEAYWHGFYSVPRINRNYLLSLLNFARTNTGYDYQVHYKKKNLLSNGYTEKEINDMLTFAGFSINDTLLEQILNSAEFIKQTIDFPFPSSVPYFKIISKQTYETPNKQLKITPQEYQHKHLERIGGHAKYEILDGTHFIYINNVDRITEITNDLLEHRLKTNN